MSRSTRFLISTMVATALLLIVLASIAFAKAPEASDADVVDSAIRATNIVTPTTDSYMPKTITDFGTYTFTYPIVLHHAISTPLTTTVRLTVTLDPYLIFDPESGTLLLPGDGTLLFPESNTIVWEPTLTYCQPATLTVTAEGTFDQGTLDLGVTALTTIVEWDGNSRDLVTRLLLYKIYLPIVVRNF